MSELMWVAVPGGPLVGGSAALRALVVPRLGNDQPTDRAPLAKLRDFGLTDWPGLLGRARLTMELTVSPDAPATPVVDAQQRDLVQPGLWQRFFPGDLAVRPWQSRTHDQPAVEPTTDHRQAIVGVYSTSAQAGADPAIVHRQLTSASLAPPAVPTGRQSVPGDGDAEFHRSVSLMREHPRVLTALGLIVEFTVPSSVLTASPRGLVRVTAQLPADAPVDLSMVSPWTWYEFDDALFLPATPDDAAPDGGPKIRRGMVDLTEMADDGRPRWEVTTFDVAGAVDLVRQTARSMTDAPAAGATLPALRSAGLNLVDRRRAASFQARNEAAAVNANRTSMVDARLAAADLVLGYRVDVKVSSGDWRPLCARTAEYFVGDDNLAVGAHGPEEGQVKANGATRAGEDAGLRADQVVVRWDGWSLVVPPDLLQRPAPRTAPAAPNLRWNFQPERLPDLRFGKQYQVRLRVADVAGGGLRISDPGENEHASDERFYGRHEPVPPPELVLPEQLPDSGALGPGGTIDLLVVRSDPANGLDADQFAAQHPYPRDPRRLLLPPQASFNLLKQLGTLDDVEDATVATWIARCTSRPTFTPDGRYSWLPDSSAAGVTVVVVPEPGAPLPGRMVKRGWPTTPEARWPDFPAKTVELRAVASAADTNLDWFDGGLTARALLAPAQQVSLAISSSPDDDHIDKFELRQWWAFMAPLSSDSLAPADLEDMLRDGRHAMATPARIVRCVHAVRRPLKDPAPLLSVHRDAGDTFGIISNPDDPLFGVDPPSTVQLDLTAAWTELIDDGHTDIAPHPVQSLPVRVDDRSIGAFRHEFGDTRHRLVSYALTAVSRFSQFFTDNEAAFLARTELSDKVSIPSTARPVPPRVLAVTPSFTWINEDTDQHWRRTRQGGRLRVELARPWYTTGVDEMLAVITRRVEGTTEPARPYLSLMHRDPIWPTPTPDSVLDELAFAGSAGVETATLAENGQEVRVVPYPAHFDIGRWYADVQIPNATSYCPFVALAVARYQKESVENLQLSTVVRAEPVQLMPDRVLTAHRDLLGLHITVSGLGPAKPNRVVAALETCPVAGQLDLTSMREDGGDIPAWRRVPEATVTGSLNEELPPVLIPWTNDALRVVVREIEDIPGESVPGPITPTGPIARELAERTVFLDILYVTSVALPD